MATPTAPDTPEETSEPAPATASPDESASPTPTADVGELPEEIVGDGVLQVATSGAFPPMNFMAEDGETVIGVSVDVITAMAEELELDVEMVVTDFAGILTGIEAGRFDAGVVFADNAERQAVVDILDVFQTGHQFLTSPGYEGSDVPPCGSTVAVAAGSNEVAVLEHLTEELCVSQGEEAFVPSEFPSNDNAALALASGRVEFFITSAENAGFRASERPEDFQQIGPVYEPALTGFAFPKAAPELTMAMADAFRQVVESGEYEEILAEWNVPDIAIEEPYINTEPIDG